MSIELSKQAVKTLSEIDSPTRGRISYEEDDDIATSDDILAIEQAEKEFAAGETMNLNDFEKIFCK